MSYKEMISNVKYQKHAVDVVVKKAIETILSGQKIARQFVIAPTGSGKTVMAGAICEFLGSRDTANSLSKRIRIIFVTHSKIMAEDFSEKFKSLNLSISTVNDVENKVFTRTDLLMINPEKFSEVSNQGKDFLEKWLGKRDNEIIVLVMDEGDVTHDGKRNKMIKDLIDPDFEICFTATFDAKKDAKRAEKSSREKSEVLHRIGVDEVISAGMIVKSHEYLVNAENATFESFMKLPVDKQNELIVIASKLPLAEQHLPKMVIHAQSSEIPDVLTQLADFLRKEYNIKLTPEMYCIINQNVNEQSIKDKDLIRFYIGDQLIGRGWDSPQSRIFTSFKNSSDLNSGIQQLGRVSRTPFQKHFDEEFDALNKGYVYVNGDHSIVEAVNSYINYNDNPDSIDRTAPVKLVKISSVRRDISLPKITTDVKKEKTQTKDSVISEITQYVKNNYLNISNEVVSEHIVSSKEIDSKTGVITHLGSHSVEIEAVPALRQLKAALVAKGIPEDTASDALSEFTQDPECKEWKKFHELLASEIEVNNSRSLIDILSKIDFETEEYVFANKTVSQEWSKNWKRSLYEFEEMGDAECKLADQIDSFCEKNGLYWTKNVEKKQIRLSLGYYPDFLIFNENGYVFMEYKGNHLLGNADTTAKIEYGEKNSPPVYMVIAKGNDFAVKKSNLTEQPLVDIEKEIITRLT